MQSIIRLSLLGMLSLAGLSAGIADDTANSGPAQNLPKHMSVKAPPYPDEALHKGLEGKAIAAFELAADGSVINSAVIYSDDSLFSKYVTEFLSNARFDMSELPGSEARPLRYRLGFVFCMPPSDLDDRFAVSSAEPVIVRASRLPTSPIRNMPAPGAAGPCVRTSR